MVRQAMTCVSKLVVPAEYYPKSLCLLQLMRARGHKMTSMVNDLTYVLAQPRFKEDSVFNRRTYLIW